MIVKNIRRKIFAISTIVIILFIVGCSSQLPEIKKIDKVSNIYENNLRVNIKKVYAWINLMPGDKPRFHITGSVELFEDSKYELEKDVLATEDDKIIEDWRRMQTSDHFYYMCTKYFNDGDVHKYFSPYESPYEAFISFMNAMSDLKLRIEKANKKKKKKDQNGFHRYYEPSMLLQRA